jgi:YggT family protein
MPLVLSNFLQLLLGALWLLIVARVIVSWLAPSGGGVVAFIYQATEPILAPIRRLLPPTGAFDWSPLIAMVVLVVLERFVARL